MQQEIEYLARTIYGEARGENLETQLYVAWVIRNRVRAEGLFGYTYQEVVTAPNEFSCWNPTDPNYAEVQNPQGAAWRSCLGIAQAVFYADEMHNPLPDVYYFYARSLDKNPPAWAKGGQILRFNFIPNMRFVRRRVK
ncbi:MAG: cell wall hydrolase [Firmicutes bacterium]|nr:cell wall hydrolase [Bacillota bacterium]